MKRLSVFIDESGTFSEYEHIQPFYIVTLVFHDQANAISDLVETLNYKLSGFMNPNKAIHTGPIIRREKEYQNMGIEERLTIFNMLYYFARKAPICYKTLIVKRKEIKDPMELTIKLSKQLAGFLAENMERFSEYDEAIVYYDNGQSELTKVILSVFSAKIGNVGYRKALQTDYKLLQVADLFCTLQLLSLKSETKSLSNSEKNFFPADKNKGLKKSYLPILKDKAFPAKL